MSSKQITYLTKNEIKQVHGGIGGKDEKNIIAAGAVVGEVVLAPVVGQAIGAAVGNAAGRAVVVVARAIRRLF